MREETQKRQVSGYHSNYCYCTMRLDDERGPADLVRSVHLTSDDISVISINFELREQPLCFDVAKLERDF